MTPQGHIFLIFALVLRALVGNSMHVTNGLGVLSDELNAPPSEINALYELYNATNGPHWRWLNSSNGFSGVPWTFNASSNPCADNWQGVICTSVPVGGYLHVMAIKLNTLGLKGQLPDNFDQYPYLEALLAQENTLTGTLPKSFGNVSKLLLLNLAYNKLTGTIPLEIGNCTALHAFTMNNNKLSGPLPEFFAGMPALVNLVLDINHLTGSIPRSFGGLIYLSTLNLGQNMLTGELISEIGNLTALQLLALNKNRLVGTIPDLSRLTQLQYIYLDYNGLHGSVPDYFGDLPWLQYITMNENYFSGSIPNSLSRSQSLQNLYLHTNQMTGTLPPELGQVTSLLLMALDVNNFTGTLPPEWGDLRQLTVLYLYINKLTGPIPSEFGQMTDLQNIDLSINAITGTVPATLCYLQQLIFFKMHKMKLHGSLPECIGNMSSLSYLSLHDNHFTSTVPASLKQLPYLNSLFIFNNEFTGSLPGFIDSALQPHLAIVQISGNRFTGQLPPDLFLLPSLQTLIGGGNCFHGSIPASICNATTATTLSLDGLRTGSSCRDVMFPGASNAYVLTAHIPGGIPDCLFKMRWLNTLHLSGNGLTGSLPTDPKISANLVDLSLSHNKLTGPIPNAFQDRLWYNFDLSYNKFQGTLSSSFGSVPGNLTVMKRLGMTVKETPSGPVYSNPRGAVVLRNNRLSHLVPESVRRMTNVTVLQGNLFGCHIDQEDLPQHDDGRFTYSCGSNAFNVSYYIYISVLAAALCLAIAAYYFREEITAYLDVPGTLEALWKWFAVVDWYDNEARRGKSRLHRYKYVVLLFDQICKVAAWCTLYIVAVEVPLYSLLSEYYGTHKYAYAWSVSAAFLSGAVTLGLELLFFCGLLVLLLYLFKLLLQRMKRFLHNLPPDFHFSVVDAYQDEEEAVINNYSSLTEKVTVYFVFFLVNVTVVAAANIGYVFAAIYAGTSYQILAQMALSVFKLVWNNFGSIYLIRWTHDYLASSATKEWKSKGAGFFAIQLFVQLFNYIVVPCVVVAAINPDCFNSAVVASPSVTSYFYYEQCEVYSALFGCVTTKTYIASTSYDPPFTYSYECSSSLITFYAPTFVYLGFIVTFVSPVWNAIMRWLHVHGRRGTTWFAIVDFWAPPVLHPVSAATVQYDKPYDIFNPYIDANYVLVTITAYLGVLLTFGFVFPPVALVMLCAIVSTVYVSRIEVGRFLSDAIADGVHKYTDIIETECQGVGSIPKLIQCIRIIVVFLCFFYTPFLFDTLGDAAGISQSFWVAFVVPAIPLLIYCAHRGYLLCHRRRYGGRAATAASTEVVRFSQFLRGPHAASLAEEARRTEEVPVHDDLPLSGSRNVEMQEAAAAAMRRIWGGIQEGQATPANAGAEGAASTTRRSSEESSEDVYNVLSNP